jgi:pimeloyl-ACP methyl ester carboxylesterase
MNLFCRIIGEGHDTVLIPSAHALSEQFRPLSMGRRLVFYDQRGRGASSVISDSSLIWTDYEVKDIETVRRYHALKSFSLIGWSYMGAVAALYSQEYSEWVSRLILVCPIAIRQPAPYDAEQNKAWEESDRRIDQTELRILEEMQQDGLEELDPIKYCRQHNRVYFARQMADARAFDRMVSDSCQHPNEWPKNHEAHMQRRFPPESRDRDWRNLLSRLEVPALVIHGSEDLRPLAASKEWAATLPNALASNPWQRPFPASRSARIVFSGGC